MVGSGRPEAVGSASAPVPFDVDLRRAAIAMVAHSTASPPPKREFARPGCSRKTPPSVATSCAPSARLLVLALAPGLVTSSLLADTPGAHGGPSAAGRPDVAPERTPAPAPSAGSAPVAPAAVRVYSIGAPTWIYPEPRRSDRPIGSVRLGQSVALRDAEPRPGAGCPRGFVAVEPFGYVCLGATATLNGATRYLEATRALAPRPGPLPFHYALSNRVPAYRRLPSPEEWAREERFLKAPGTFGELSWGNRGHERLAVVAVVPPNAPPPAHFAAGGAVTSERPAELVRRFVPLGSMVAFTSTFVHAGRTWLASADGTAVPADRVRVFRVTQFRGVELRDGLRLPLAWFRATPRPQYVREGDGSFVATGEQWPARGHVMLEAGREPVADGAGRRFLATRARRGEDTMWAAESDATVVEPRAQRPWGVGEQDKWIEVSITRGTLVAYVGARPVFATLVSPGAGGVPQPGRDPVRASTTPTGVHRVFYKYRSQTMSPDEGEERTFWIADVPHTQYFSPPFALHTAYWHESFGEPMSAGCINLAPEDGAWLFDWTEPRVPREWEGAAPHALTGAATTIAVYR